MLEYQLIRSKRRKTLGLQVRHGQVTVRAPYYVSADFIENFVEEKSSWLKAKVLQQASNVECCQFKHGTSLLFLGERHIVNISLAKQAKVYTSEAAIGGTTLENDISSSPYQHSAQKIINVVISNRVDSRLSSSTLKARQVKKQLESYFKEQAEQLISQRLKQITKQIRLTPSKVIIRQYRARWGSCNNRGEVSFNYLLMMAPVFVIDYVIVHELCHLSHLNHSKEFWQLVAQYLPNYQEAKKWLKSNQSELYWHTPA